MVHTADTMHAVCMADGFLDLIKLYSEYNEANRRGATHRATPRNIATM